MFCFSFSPKCTTTYLFSMSSKNNITHIFQHCLHFCKMKNMLKIMKHNKKNWLWCPSLFYVCCSLQDSMATSEYKKSPCICSREKKRAWKFLFGWEVWMIGKEKKNWVQFVVFFLIASNDSSVCTRNILITETSCCCFSTRK